LLVARLRFRNVEPKRVADRRPFAYFIDFNCFREPRSSHSGSPRGPAHARVGYAPYAGSLNLKELTARKRNAVTGALSLFRKEVCNGQVTLARVVVKGEDAGPFAEFRKFLLDGR